MTSTGKDPQNGLKLTQLNAATASAGNTDGCLTGHLSEEGVGLMPHSNTPTDPGKSFVLTLATTGVS